MAIQYQAPDSWIKYDPSEIVHELTQAKAAVLSLSAIPFQRSWAEALQEMELKREVAGTSKIEGADFTDREFEEAVSDKREDRDLTRSQLQARAAINTYRYIEKIERDRPVTVDLVKDLHRRIVTGCDEDHCPPGELRDDGHNVTFGRPRHRGADGGRVCKNAFERLILALNREFKDHDGLVQALAVHYHIGAIHPFHDGNGRTARVMEALLLKRADLKDTLFIAMSNYYYDEKDRYLATLCHVAQNNHDLTAFLKFGLRGIAKQSNRMLAEIRRHVSRSLFRDVMFEMYGRLKSTRKRALAGRQLSILSHLLEQDSPISLELLRKQMEATYFPLKADNKAFIKDLDDLSSIRAISVEKREVPPGRAFYDSWIVAARLEWPTEITETTFYEELNKLPQARTRAFG